MDNLKKIILPNFFILVSLVIISVVVFFQLRNSYCAGDILHEGLAVDFKYFILPVHGRYFAGLITRMPGIFNAIFGLHPFDFINSYGAIFISISYSIICLKIVDLFSLFNHKDSFILIPIFLIFCWYVTMYFPAIEYWNWTQFCGYYFLLIFYFIGCSTVIKHFVNNTIPNNNIKTITLNSIIIILIGFSSHLENISFIIFYSCLLVFLLIQEGIKNKWKISEILKQIKQNFVPIIFPYILLIVSTILTYLNPACWDFPIRENQISFDSNTIYNLFINVHSFINDFIQIFIYNYKYLYFFLFYSSILAFVLSSDKKQTLRYCFITCCLLFSILFFLFNLWILGNHCDGSNENWLHHLGLKNLFFCISLYLFFGYLGLLYKNLKLNRIVKIIIICICITFLIKNYFNNIYFFKDNFIDIPLVEKDIRKSYYIMEKMAIFYFVRNEVAILPIDNIYCFDIHDLYESDGGFIDLKNNTFNIFEPSERVLKYGFILQRKNDLFQLYKKYYWYYIYPKKFSKDKEQNFLVKFVPKEEAMEKFKKKGGIITPEEIEKTNFTSIKNQYNK